MVAVLAVSLDDGTGNVAARRRALLEIVTDTTGTVVSKNIKLLPKTATRSSNVATTDAVQVALSDVAQTPVQISPPVVNYAVDIVNTIRSIQGIQEGCLVMLEVSASAFFSTSVSNEEIKVICVVCRIL